MVVSRLDETLEPRGSGTPADREAWHLYLRAVNQWEPTCDAAALLDLLDRAIELQPEFLPAWYMLGGVRITQAKFCSGATGAVERLEQVIVRLAELAPDSSTPDALRANLLLYQGQPEEALTLLEQAATRFGEDDLGIRIHQVIQCRYVAFWNDQHMRRGLWIDIPECDHIIRFKNNVRIDIFANDLAEKTV